MSTLKGTTMHPRCRHIGETYLNVDFSSSAQVKFNFELFKKKIKFLVSRIVASTREDLSVDISITNVGLILTKPGRFCFSAYGNSGFGQNSISSISNFLKNFHIFGFPWCSTREDLSIDVSITNVGLILTKLWWYLFSGTDRRTDRHGFGILIWKHVVTQKISTQSSKLVVSRRSRYASPEFGDA